MTGALGPLETRSAPAVPTQRAAQPNDPQQTGKQKTGSLHPLLGRQLSRLGLNLPGLPPGDPVSVPAREWHRLLERVSGVYLDADNDRYTLERSIDISGGEMIALYEQLRERAEFTRAIVDNAAEAILTIDLNGRISSFNPAAERMFGWAVRDIVGQDRSVLLPANARFPWTSPVATGEPGQNAASEISVEARGLRRDGTDFPIMVSLSVVAGGGGNAMTAVIRDISDQKTFEAQLRYQAGHDALTGLPNRARFQQLLDEALQQAAQDETGLALLFCDLDRFKLINDSLGHGIGDSVLIRAAERFRSAVRSRDLVARLSGDEFVVLCPRITGLNEARVVAESIVSAFGDSIHIDGHEIVVSVSVGVVGADTSISAEDMVRKADLAMYEAKRAGRSRVQVYETGMVSLVTARLDIENGLRTAIRENQLVLHYQPIVRTSDGAITKVEALVRWERPGHGLVPPGMFLSVAEEAGLAPAMDRWVLEEACAEAATWPSDIIVSVNLSERLLSQTGVIELVTDVLRRSGLPADRLGIEVTEHLLGSNVPEAVRALRQLRQLQVGVYLDDFGTEYSSLSRLRQLGLDVLKIDQSFVADLSQSSAQVIVSAIVTMAHGLGLEVVAEGVEEEEQLATLIGLGCDAVQGFLLSRPVPQEALRALLSSGAPAVASRFRRAG